jgi:hypothetical protein
MTAKKLLIIILFFSAFVPIFAQKTMSYNLLVNSAIWDFLRENTAKIPENRSIIAQNTFYTEGSSFVKMQLELEKKNTFDSDSFQTSFVIDTDKKSTVDGHFSLVKYLSVFGHFDGDRGAGGGIAITY